MYLIGPRSIVLFAALFLRYYVSFSQEIPLSDTANYDIYRYIVYTTSGTTGITDTTVEIEYVPRIAKIFKGGRVYTYQAIYQNEEGDTLSNRKIWLTATGKRWRKASKRETEVHYEFEGVLEDSSRFSPHPLNPTFSSWKPLIATGAIENEKELWVFPARHNQYIFTQLAPIPKVEFPLEKGKTWENTFRVRGYGEWHNQQGTFDYEVKKVVEQDFPFIGKLACWEIHATAQFPAGTTNLIYLFHPYYGFVEMNYTNFAKETLTMELVDIKE